MAKFLHDDILDAGLALIKANGTRLCVCSTQPTTYTEAITTYKLAIKTITTTDFTGPADDTSGRKLTANAATGMTVDADGDAVYVAVCDSVNSKLLAVTSITLQTLYTGNTCDVAAFKINIPDPA
jgi:hypothetical protein